MVEELCYYIKERLPFIRKQYGKKVNVLDKRHTGMFFSCYGAQMTVDTFCQVTKRFYGILLGKYTHPRLVRFNLGHELYSCMDKSDINAIALLCYMINHSYNTHLQYYVIRNHNTDFHPS